MIPFKEISDFAKMPLKTRYNLLIGLVVFCLCSVIVYYEKKIIKRDETHRITVTGIVNRYSAREAALEAKVDFCNQNYLLYLQKSEKEYRELLFEAKKLKQEIKDENIK